LNKKTLVVTLLSLLLLAGYVPMVSAHGGTSKVDYPSDPTHLVIDTFGEPETMDYAWCYDSASGEVLQAVYDTLVRYKIDPSLGPYDAADPVTGEFDPILATEWSAEDISETSPEGVNWVKRVYFKIRENVKMHDDTTLTPEDVEYSFERQMVQDRDGGPTWMLWEPLLECYGASAPADDSAFGNKIDHAVESNSTHVWFNIAAQFPTAIIYQITAYVGTGGIISKEWAVLQGDFDGNWAAGWAAIYAAWHDPAVSFIENAEMGTGAYKLDYWTHGTAYSIVKFD